MLAYPGYLIKKFSTFIGFKSHVFTDVKGKRGKNNFKININQLGKQGEQKEELRRYQRGVSQTISVKMTCTQ